MAFRWLAAVRLRHQSLPTKIIRDRSASYSATKLEERLRRPASGVSVIARVEEDRVLLDLRTVFPEQEPQLRVSSRRPALNFVKLSSCLLSCRVKIRNPSPRAPQYLPALGARSRSAGRHLQHRRGNSSRLSRLSRSSWPRICRRSRRRHGVSAAEEKRNGSASVSPAKSTFPAPLTAIEPVCAFCRRGLKTHCARRTVLGIVNHDGAFAEYLALPLENLHLIPQFHQRRASRIRRAARRRLRNSRPNAIFANSQAAVLGDGKLAQLIARVLHRLPARHSVWQAQRQIATGRRSRYQHEARSRRRFGPETRER